MGTKIKGKAEKTVLDGTEAVPVDSGGSDRHVLFTTIKNWILGLLTTDDISVINDGSVTHLGDLSHHLAHASSPYVATGADVTDNGDGTVTVTAGEVWLKTTNDLDGDFEAFVVATDDFTITAETNVILYIDYNAGTPIYAQRVSTAGYFYSNWDEIPFATVVNDGTKIIVNDFKDTVTNGVYKNVLGQINYQPFRYIGGLSASDGGTRNPDITAGALLFSNDYYPIAAFQTSVSDTFTRAYVTAGTWTRTLSQTTIDNTQYNDTTLGMVSISNNKFANKYLYHIKDTPSYWVLLEGQAQYDTLVDAEDASLPSTLPAELSPFYAGALLVAVFIVKQGQAAFQDIQNPFETPFTSSAASLHNNLGGLELAATGITYGHVDATQHNSYLQETIIIACSDETTALTTGTAKATFRMPFALTLTDVRASLTTAGTTSGTTTVDINESGTTILSTKITIDYSELTSETAATPPVISDTALADDAQITIDIDAISGGATEAGLKVTLIGYRS